jgi:uncharacterized SAM-binding protein YcdF (DUF218 family)
MYSFKQLLESSLAPLGIVSFLMFIGLLPSWRGGTSWRRNLSLRTGAFLFLLFVFSPLAEIIIGTLERQYPPLQELPEWLASAPTIVVLSEYAEAHSSTPVTSNLSEDMLYRVVEGIRLYRLSATAKLLMSGGILRRGDPPVAQIMADFARAQGVRKEDLLVETKSQNTYENLLEVQKMLGSKPFILVTSAYHLPRAMAVARKLQLHVTAAPARIITLQHFPALMGWQVWIRTVAGSFLTPSLGRLTLLQRAYHEYVGYGWYWILGRI